MAVFGVLVAIAAVQTSRNAPEANASRASLIEQIQARRDNVAALQERLERLRTSTTDLRAALAQAEEDGQVLAARIERLEARTGLAPVSGPGLRITVDDAPDGDVTQQVRDSDLAILVDGLWNAGAEAISVNGKRLTNLTAFDNVGPADPHRHHAAGAAVHHPRGGRSRHPRRRPAREHLRPAVVLPGRQPGLRLRHQARVGHAAGAPGPGCGRSAC